MMLMMLLLLLLFFINNLFNVDDSEFGIGLSLLSNKELSIDVKFAGVGLPLKIHLFCPSSPFSTIYMSRNVSSYTCLIYKIRYVPGAG